MAWWGKKQLIKDLTPGEMVRIATQLLRKSGRNQSSYRLIYHALVMNPYEQEGLLRLAEFFDDGRTQHGSPGPYHLLSGLVLDYALGRESGVPPEHRISLQKLRLKLVWAWGFAKVAVSKDQKEGGDDLSSFTLDEEGFLTFISKAATPYGSYEKAFIAAHTIIGVKGGIIAPRAGGPNLQLWEINRFNHIPMPAYEEWLKSDAEHLKRLEQR